MITANTQPALPATTSSPFETTAPPLPLALPATADPAKGCPACGFPIRRIYAGELICPSCGRRETLAGEFWARIVEAMVGGLTYGRSLSYERHASDVNGVRL